MKSRGTRIWAPTALTAALMCGVSGVLQLDKTPLRPREEIAASTVQSQLALIRRSEAQVTEARVAAARHPDEWRANFRLANRLWWMKQHAHRLRAEVGPRADEMLLI